MNILSFIQSLCYRLFYGNTHYKSAKTSCYVAQGNLIPPQVVAKMSYSYPHGTACQVSDRGKPLTSRQFSTSSVPLSPNLAPYSKLTKNQGNVQIISSSQVQDSLIQSIQTQINQLEGTKQAILREMTLNHSNKTSFTSIYPISKVVCSENIGKHAELAKLNVRLKSVSQFCNQEMIEVVSLITEGYATLNERLMTLRKEASLIEDENLLCKNIEHIVILEDAVEAMYQLETKFQGMQKKSFPTSQSTPNQQESYVNFLLQKVSQLHKQTQFLEECQQNLPAYAAYDAQELNELMQLFGNEAEELSQKTEESRVKLNQAGEFANELTNHLLDYTEIFNIHFQKLQSQVQPVKVATPAVRATPIAVQPIITRLNPQTYTLKPTPVVVHAQMQTSNADGFDSHQLTAAANDVAQAIKQLLQITSA